VELGEMMLLLQKTVELVETVEQDKVLVQEQQEQQVQSMPLEEPLVTVELVVTGMELLLVAEEEVAEVTIHYLGQLDRRLLVKTAVTAVTGPLIHSEHAEEEAVEEELVLILETVETVVLVVLLLMVPRRVVHIQVLVEIQERTWQWW
jgi:hypothetical protein